MNVYMTVLKRQINVGEIPENIIRGEFSNVAMPGYKCEICKNKKYLKFKFKRIKKIYWEYWLARTPTQHGAGISSGIL